uniref:Uncharacterized protein n=1 Tax=Tanacetum cinerariifolium TaxID=118510 RepID=A0A6L2KTD2_TANCI|nr:hypothetical protein [Tanacetum cinerariifolium]
MTTSSNVATNMQIPTANVATDVTVSPMGLISSVPTSYAKLVTSEKSKKSVNFHTLITLAGNGAEVTVSEDGLSAIITKLGNPLMLDLYTSDMSMQSLGRSSYARAMIELQADDEYPRNIGLDVVKNLKKAGQVPRGVSVGTKVGFKPVKQVYKAISKKNSAFTSENKKKDVKASKEGGSSKLASKEVNSSGSSFWNVESSSINTIPIVNKINKIEKLIIEGKVTLVDDEGKHLKKVDYSGDKNSDDEVESVDNEIESFLASKRVGYGTNSLLEQWRHTYENVDYDYDAYDDDMYEGQEIPDNIQSLCDRIDIKVRGRKNK